MTTYGSPEHVFVENEWYDGPRTGIANVNGKPHRFVSQFDYTEDDFLGTYLVWPIDPDELALEQEQWQIFVNWNTQYEAGAVRHDSHPGNPGTNKRWDEISSLLDRHRSEPPAHARLAKAQIVFLERESRYQDTGPCYQLCWRLV